MRIDRKFTGESQDPFKGIRFVERGSKINNADGSLVAEIKNVLVPDTWSQVAVDIMAQKYFRKAGHRIYIASQNHQVFLKYF